MALAKTRRPCKEVQAWTWEPSRVVQVRNRGLCG